MKERKEGRQIMEGENTENEIKEAHSRVRDRVGGVYREE